MPSILSSSAASDSPSVTAAKFTTDVSTGTPSSESVKAVAVCATSSIWMMLTAAAPPANPLSISSRPLNALPRSEQVGRNRDERVAELRRDAVERAGAAASSVAVSMVEKSRLEKSSGIPFRLSAKASAAATSPLSASPDTMPKCAVAGFGVRSESEMPG